MDILLFKHIAQAFCKNMHEHGGSDKTWTGLWTQRITLLAGKITSICLTISTVWLKASHMQRKLHNIGEIYRNFVIHISHMYVC